jgi:hypothetical protein
MSNPFSRIIKEERHICRCKSSDAIVIGPCRYSSNIVANAVLGIHGVGNGKIIQGSRFARFALEGIDVSHV